MNNTNYAHLFVRLITVLTALVSGFFTLFVWVPSQFNASDFGIYTAIATVVIFLAIFGTLLYVAFTAPEKIINFFTGKSKNTKVLMFLMLLFTITACHKVPAGHRAVKVYLYGDDKGVDNFEILSPGRYMVGWNVDFFDVPIFERSYNFTDDLTEGEARDESIYFQSGQGTKMGADIAIRYQIEPEALPDLFESFRGDIDARLRTVFKNALRDELNAEAAEMSIEQLVGAGRVQMMKRIEVSITKLGADMGVKVIDVQMTSDLEVPSSIRKAIDEKVKRIQEAEQREYELRERAAQFRLDSINVEIEKQKIIGTAQARAEANRIESASLTKQLLQQQKIKKWDGKYPQVVGEGSNLLIDVGQGN